MRGGEGSLPPACAERAPSTCGFTAGVRRTRGEAALHSVRQVQAWSGRTCALQAPTARASCGPRDFLPVPRLGKDGGRGSLGDSNSPAAALRGRPTSIGPVDGERDFSERIPSPLLGNGAPGAPCSYLFGEPETERLIKRPSRSPSWLRPARISS
ncbi:hypothetical protein NDU88_007844 [Pleurodeles waltl]|uniref:Uncharacterized protein n=1 Tax=Pleurodeles waltl TaxID=8319 RepID=A0AAV7STW0_PLEWA|nr:hypothetical protein NDU88_007844 [Pleurodeles waltl]